jgi:diguanylate cyclase (GGDEF)-like protein
MSEPHALASLPPVVEEKLRRLTLCTLPVGILILVMSWYQNEKVHNRSLTNHIGLPTLGLLFILVWVPLLQRRLSGQLATVIYISAFCLFLGAEQLEQSLTGLLYTYGDPGSFSWICVMYTLFFLILDSRRARIVCLLFVALNATTYFGGLLHFRATPEVHTSYINHFLASLIIIAILGPYADLKQHLGKAQSLASTDSLTGLLNRRQMQLLLEKAIQHERHFVLLLLDIDHFKQVNDRLGHNVGDSVLREVSQRLRESLRQDDLLGRWGGEEFLALLPQTAHDDAEQLAERLLQSIRQHAFPHELSVTVSIGATHALEGERPEDIVHRADLALYHAKQAGRNRFHFHATSHTSQAA